MKEGRPGLQTGADLAPPHASVRDIGEPAREADTGGRYARSFAARPPACHRCPMPVVLRITAALAVALTACAAGAQPSRFAAQSRAAAR